MPAYIKIQYKIGSKLYLALYEGHLKSFEPQHENDIIR